MPDSQPGDDRAELLQQLTRLAATSPSLEALQTAFVEAASKRLPHYNWTGFYMLDPADPDMLMLGPFAGEPTPHVRISVDQGICGAAVANAATIVVDDVSSDNRYLSCSIKTKSEIVVPIYVHGKIVGEIDIDSHDLAAFAEADRAFLESAATIIGSYMEAHPG
jgi:L-methionine (R)-S-oxide reductase